MGMVRNVASFLLVAVLLMTHAKATTYTVGEADGWNSGIDYRAWASGKSLQVGDIIVFKYTIYHDVRRVSEKDYNSCITSHPIDYYKSTSGNATIVLTERGKVYFVCGSIGHCRQGMKVVIDSSGLPYSDNSPPPPASRLRSPPPPTANSANRFSKTCSFALVLMMLLAITI